MWERRRSESATSRTNGSWEPGPRDEPIRGVSCVGGTWLQCLNRSLVVGTNWNSLNPFSEKRRSDYCVWPVNCRTSRPGPYKGSFILGKTYSQTLLSLVSRRNSTGYPRDERLYLLTPFGYKNYSLQILPNLTHYFLPEIIKLLLDPLIEALRRRNQHN